MLKNWALHSNNIPVGPLQFRKKPLKASTSLFEKKNIQELNEYSAALDFYGALRSRTYDQAILEVNFPFYKDIKQNLYGCLCSNLGHAR